MNESRVAAPYAKSLLELAREKGVLDQVAQDMKLFVDINKQNPQFARIIRNPIITHEKKRLILDKLLKGKVSSLTMSMFDIITRKNREAYLYFIAKEFTKQYKVMQGIQTAEIMTAVPLTETQVTSFIEMVKQLSGQSKVELKQTVAESILGGFLLKIGDRQVDQSIRTKLNQIRNKFSDNSYLAK